MKLQENILTKARETQRPLPLPTPSGKATRGIRERGPNTVEQRKLERISFVGRRRKFWIVPFDSRLPDEVVSGDVASPYSGKKNQ
jgi:hypothetical protein